MRGAGRRLVRMGVLLAALGMTGTVGLGANAWWHGRQLLNAPPPEPADVALVLGNRVWLDDAPNPCLVSRVEAAVGLARQGRVQQLLMSGGTDPEDGRNQAREMEVMARAAGYAGLVLREEHAESTRENLLKAWPLLQQAGARRVVVVSEAGHLWRVERLARASGFDRAFDVQFLATACERPAGRAWRAALREPLAILKNALHGWI